MSATAAALEARCFTDPWTDSQVAAELRAEWSLGWAAIDGGGDLLGYCLGRMVGDELEILRLAVRPEVRRCGIGRSLVGATLHDAARRGAGSVHLEVNRVNESAVALYGAEGFVVCGVRKGYYDRGNGDALLMVKTLRGPNPGEGGLGSG